MLIMPSFKKSLIEEQFQENYHACMLKKIRRENRKRFLMSMLSVIIAAFPLEAFVSCRKHVLDLDKNSEFCLKKMIDIIM